MKMKRFLMCVSLSLVAPWAAVARPAQQVSPQVWEGNDAYVGKGTRIALPGAILKAIVAKSRNCPNPAQGNAEMFEAYRFKTKGASLIAVKGGGTCECSPTGNCSFGVCRRLGDRYLLILSSSMVQQFGFLKFKSYGLPDIVTWSHGSAFESGAHLWQFDGRKYAKRCSWDAVFREGSEESEIENNTCQAQAVKEGHSAKKH
jgi:hypothetical protein